MRASPIESDKPFVASNMVILMRWFPVASWVSPDSATVFPTGASVQNLGYMPGLDGIRGLSIALVIGCHTSLWFMLGGGIGVDIFFVMSGFLISRVLVAEFRCTGRIDFVSFYWRRFLRIVPPLLGVCVGLLCVAPLARVPYSALAQDYSVTLTFVADYTRARGGIPLYLAPTWSLAIEEQFYLLWPFIALALMTFVRVPARIIALLLFVAIAVAVWRFSRFEAAQNLMAVYDSFDARFDALCFGCMLAFLDEPSLRKVGKFWPLALGVLGAFVYGSEWSQPWMYYGGFSLVGGSAAIMVAAAAGRNSPVLSSLLELRTLRWLGKISYSLYLWHWPPLIILWIADIRGMMLISSVPVGLFLAVLSTIFIERPALALKDLNIRWIRVSAALVVPVLFAVGVFYVLPRVHL
jgi:peptidoglycan/LPS O-acetylase OafA/YrhL